MSGKNERRENAWSENSGSIHKDIIFNYIYVHTVHRVNYGIFYVIMSDLRKYTVEFFVSLALSANLIFSEVVRMPNFSWNGYDWTLSSRSPLILHLLNPKAALYCFMLRKRGFACRSQVPHMIRACALTILFLSEL